MSVVSCSEILKWNEEQEPGWPERYQPSGSPEFLCLVTTTTLVQVGSTLQPFALQTSRLIFLFWSLVSLLYWSLPRANQCGSILYCSCRWWRVPLWKPSSTISLSTLSDNNGVASSLVSFNFLRSFPNARSDAEHRRYLSGQSSRCSPAKQVRNPRIEEKRFYYMFCSRWFSEGG